MRYLILFTCFLFSACGKSGSEPAPASDPITSSGGGTTQPPVIPTKVYGVYGIAINTPDIYAGRLYRVETSNWPSGNNAHQGHLLQGAGSLDYTLKNADTEPRIDSAGNGPARAYYTNVVKADALTVVAADTLTKLAVVVNNGAVRRVFVICQLPNVVGSGGIQFTSIVKDYYRVTNTFIRNKIDTATGLKELQNTFQ